MRNLWVKGLPKTLGVRLHFISLVGELARGVVVRNEMACRCDLDALGEVVKTARFSSVALPTVPHVSTTPHVHRSRT